MGTLSFGLRCLEPPDWADLWDHLESFVQLSVRISGCSDGIDASFELFLLALKELTGYIWHCKKSEDDDLFWLLDENLLKICKKGFEAQGAGQLQLWRKRLVKYKKCWYLDDQLDWKQFVVRSLQYIDETSAKATAQVIVTKIAEGVMPNELADMIVTALTGIPPTMVNAT